jgi:hypothetical protein
MSGVLTAAVLAVAIAAIILILVLTAPRRKSPRSTSKYERDGDPDREKHAEGATGTGRRWPCPLCGALLGPGEKIRSVMRFSPTHGKIMEISGCPRCLPPLSRPRACPVCKAELGPHEFLTASVFDRSRESAKPHVHVLGCNRCRG